MRLRRHLTALLSAAALLLTGHTPAYAATYPPDLIGHRGIGDPWTVELNIPEQSIPAAKWAAANHADIIEGDCQQTASGAPVMMHDARLERTTNGTGYVIDRSTTYITGRWLELPIDRDGSARDPLDGDNTPYHPPTCKQWLAAVKATGKLAFIELKHGEHWSRADVKAYVDMVNALGMQDRVITAGSELKLSYVKSYSTRIDRSMAVSSKPSTTKIKSVVGSNGYTTISLTNADRDPAYIKTLDNAGLKVLVYTLDGPPHYERAIKHPFTGWMCDNTRDADQWLKDRDV
jgi:glycerophosphoryl diester phosphodiesterase